MKSYQTLQRQQLIGILEQMQEQRIAVLGDCCLDIYWYADMRRSELSRETPHFNMPIVREVVSPGGAANVAANLSAIGVPSPLMLGYVGDDWRGGLLQSTLQQHKVDGEGLVTCRGLITNTYAKPIRKGISPVATEDPRLDFLNDGQPTEEDEQRLIEKLRHAATSIQVLCVCDQLKVGCITPRLRAEVNRLIRMGLTVIVDSRENISLYPGAILKPNEVEGARAVGLVGDSHPSVPELVEIAALLAERAESVVCMTAGDLGNVICQKGACTHIPAVPIQGEIDFVGAGDTFLSAFAAAVATKADYCTASLLANLAASVTIKKLGQTGTATPEEILQSYDRLEMI